MGANIFDRYSGELSELYATGFREKGGMPVAQMREDIFQKFSARHDL